MKNNKKLFSLRFNFFLVLFLGISSLLYLIFLPSNVVLYELPKEFPVFTDSDISYMFKYSFVCFMYGFTFFGVLNFCIDKLRDIYVEYKTLKTSSTDDDIL